MTAQRIKKLTVEEYVALEQSTGIKHEYHNGEVFAMSGGTFNHSILCSRIHIQLNKQLELNKKKCETLTSEMKLHIEAFDKCFYPDAMVVCGDFKRPENFKDAIINPLVIVEVLSAKTANYDRGDKFAKYRSIDSFREYILIEQDKPSVEIYYRKDANNLWQINYYEGLDKTFHLQSLQIDIAMKALYERVVFKMEDKK